MQILLSARTRTFLLQWTDRKLSRSRRLIAPRSKTFARARYPVVAVMSHQVARRPKTVPIDRARGRRRPASTAPSVLPKVWVYLSKGTTRRFDPEAMAQTAWQLPARSPARNLWSRRWTSQGSIKRTRPPSSRLATSRFTRLSKETPWRKPFKKVRLQGYKFVCINILCY